MTTVDFQFNNETKNIPFEATAPLEPFYSNSNMEQLKKANQQVKNGQVIEKTMEELEAMELD